MSFYSDLSRPFRDPNVVAVGWLDGRHPFPTARPAKWMIEKLWEYCYYVLNPTGGFHDCDLSDCHGPCRRLASDYSGRKRPTARKILEDYDRSRARLFSKAYARYPETFIAEALAQFDERLRIAMRGYSRMHLGVHPVTRQRIYLGQAEIWIFGRRRRVYRAPNMLYHYVTVHNYKPPKEFVSALKRAPCPPQPEYLALLERVGFPPKYVQAYAEFWKKRQIRKNARKPKST